MRVTQAERERTREALVRHGLELFAGRGFARATVDQVASAAGVAKGTFYNYFRSKEDLALAALVVALDGVGKRRDEMLGLPTLGARLTVLFTELGRASGGNPELIWLWTVENLRRGRAEAASARFDAIVRAFCEDAQRRGELRADVTADALALQLVGAVLARIARWHHGGAESDLLEDLMAAVTLFLEGAGRTGAGPG